MIRIADLPKRFCANKGRSSSHSALLMSQLHQQHQARGARTLARPALLQLQLTVG